MVTVERFHDRGLLQELNAISNRGIFIDCFNSYLVLLFVFYNAVSDAFIHHTKRTLAQLSKQLNLVTRYLPFIRDIDYEE